MINVCLNGESRESTSKFVAELIDELELVPETLLIEHNGTALHRSQWTETALRNGDRIEMLRVTAGG